MTQYKGWSNWDTYNAALHLTNDVNLYPRAKTLSNAKDIKGMQYLISQIADIDGIKLSCVDVIEIIDSIRGV